MIKNFGDLRLACRIYILKITAFDNHFLEKQQQPKFAIWVAPSNSAIAQA
jgi:hypothetical protein